MDKGCRTETVREYKANVTSQIFSEIGSWGWERAGRWRSWHRGGLRQVTSPRKTRRTVSPSANPNGSTHTQTATTISHLFPPPIHIGRLHFRIFFKETNYKKILISKKKSKKKIKRFQLKIPKLQSAFVKLELHGIVFISIVVRFSSTNWEDTNRYSF